MGHQEYNVSGLVIAISRNKNQPLHLMLGGILPVEAK